MVGPAALSSSIAWVSERESAAELDRLLIPWVGHFNVYHEVRGKLLQPKLLQEKLNLRIDRILVPRRPAIDAGWGHGAVGIEIKKPGIPLGPAIAQSIDYCRSAWFVQGVWLLLSCVFLWPVEKQSGPLASLLTDTRVGTVDWHRGNGLRFALGEEVVLRLGTYGQPDVFLTTDRHSGRRVGSR